MNKSGAQAVNSQSLTFETNYTQKLHFYAVSGHKPPPDDQTIQFWHQVSKQFWKLWSHGFLGTKFRGGLEFCINGRRFFQRERLLCDWLAGPSLMGGIPRLVLKNPSYTPLNTFSPFLVFPLRPQWACDWMWNITLLYFGHEFIHPKSHKQNNWCYYHWPM